MYPRRVVITGMGAVSPFGAGVESMWDGLVAGNSAVGELPSGTEISGLSVRAAGMVPPVNVKVIPRQYRRSMSRMTQYAVLAAQEALDQANIPDAVLASGRLGISVGSTIGSADALEEFFTEYVKENSLEAIRSTTFFKVMGHTVAANLAQVLGVTGRVEAPSAACASGCQAIGLAYESVAYGRQDVMLCGGADEFSPLTAATFGLMNAASSNDATSPDASSRPFDSSRDGIVCAEGAGLLVVESLEHAQARGATIFAEIVGFASNSSPSSIANPDANSIKTCIELALKDASVSPVDVDYISAHATGTEQGDIAEATAIAEIFTSMPMISSLKGHMGHTMAASGALESIASVLMITNDIIVPTRNLTEVDPRCGAVNLPVVNHNQAVSTVVKNSFALGGINSVLVIRNAT
ncbi:beta-ketoacyl-[acyl-carrier-protein] synthase family protein [Halodesulfovibrio sp.]|uniref:beta-ketoacyl-[acyl-carrier-protein] synthase family protein n=1 Tax=Halodesulfovibrio sp. TaxID=1912772 RepID=UPI0025BBDCE2|nr:beta-ketoacyl-[acyl-carrier-protein] synthase family protein [Halodesulfovibrio sp.]